MPNVPRINQPGKPAPLCLDLLALYDQLVAHQDSCTFFCDAVTALLAESAELERGTLEGMNEFVERLRQGRSDLREEFKNIQEKCSAER